MKKVKKKNIITKLYIKDVIRRQSTQTRCFMF